MTQLTDQATIFDRLTVPGNSEQTFLGTADVVQETTPPGWILNLPAKPGIRCEEITSETLGGPASSTGISQPPTSDRSEGDREMLLLEAAARADNGLIFVTILKSIRWDTRKAEDYNKAIRLALSAGYHPSAWKLSEEGAKRFPDDAELQRIWHIFAPSKAVISALPSKINASADILWLKENRAMYQGKWVALKDGNLLAVGEGFQELFDKVGNTKGRGILITLVY
jgi:hypothetical protein